MYRKCFRDAPWFREIPTLLDIPPYQMSIELCLDTGEAAGYNVCPLQYGQECCELLFFHHPLSSAEL